mmetsp:Transcript_43410/g.169858  ORF Transcript_43410/g.169858 Transcript_43410/m.169858 type:complete len:242 (-) Transcript_43410:188-913(-)
MPVKQMLEIAEDLASLNVQYPQGNVASSVRSGEYQQEDIGADFDLLDPRVYDGIEKLVVGQTPNLVLVLLRRESQDLAVQVVKLHKARPSKRFGLEESEASVCFLFSYVLQMRAPTPERGKVVFSKDGNRDDRVVHLVQVQRSDYFVVGGVEETNPLELVSVKCDANTSLREGENKIRGCDDLCHFTSRSLERHLDLWTLWIECIYFDLQFGIKKLLLHRIEEEPARFQLVGLPLSKLLED